MSRAEGTEIARKFMKHNPRSEVFKTHYDQGVYDLDVVSIAMGEDSKENKTLMEQEECEALRRVSLVKQDRARSRVISKFIHAHPDLKAAKESGDKMRSRVVHMNLKRHALRAILDEETAMQQTTHTIQERAQRIKTLNQPGNLFNMMMKRVKDESNEPMYDLFEGDANEYDELEQSYRDVEEMIESEAFPREVSSISRLKKTLIRSQLTLLSTWSPLTI